MRDVVFIHGWGVDETVWNGFIKDHFYNYRVHKINLQELWQSSKNSQDQISGVVRAMEPKIPNQAFIVAWSMGAIFAIKFCSLFESKQNPLFLLCANPCFIKKQNWVFGIDSKNIFDMKNSLLIEKNKTLSGFYSLAAMGSKNIKQVANTLKENVDLDTMDINFLSFGLDVLSLCDSRNEIGNLNTPATMCFAENDALVSKNLYYNRPIINKRISYEIVEQACHAPFLCSPQETAKVIKKYLQ